VSAILRRAAAALGGFLRGFLGLEAGAGGALHARTPRAARRALERRAGARGSCC
jgi:hypothetical protein